MSLMRFRLRRTRLILLPVVAATLIAGTARADEAAEISKLLRAGQNAEAVKRADAYLARVPRDAQVRFLKGVALADTKPAEAIAIFAALTEDYPRLPEPYNNLAVLYAASGQYEKASAALDKAMRTNPAYAIAYQNLGDVHARLASLEYEKALQVDASAGAKVKLTLMQTLGSPAASLAAASSPQDARQSPPIAGKAEAKPAQKPVELAAATVTPIAPVAPQAKAAAPAKAAVPPLALAEPASRHLQDARPETRPPEPARPEAKPAPAKAESHAAPAKPEAPPARLAKAEKTEKVERSDARARAAQEAAAERSAVMSTVTAWAHAWSERDVPGYLAHYAPDFEPGKGLTRKAWAEERHARISGKGRIEVRIEKPQIEVDGNNATVRFHQVYVSDRLSASSRKTLLLSRQRNGKWQIRRETTG
jgi:ketosteroid isomerase-like protein